MGERAALAGSASHLPESPFEPLDGLATELQHGLVLELFFHGLSTLSPVEGPVWRRAAAAAPLWIVMPSHHERCSQLGR